MQDFQNKVAVITGTANPQGIGLAIARRLAGAGCKVVLADLDGDGAQARAAELSTDGASAIAVQTDMGDHASVVALADSTYDRFGAAHIVVLNHVAPTGGPGHGLLNPDPAAWELHARVNLLGTVYGIKAFVPQMIAGGEHCHVLATTSGAGGTGTMYGNGPYAVTKAAIVSVMQCLYGQLRDAGADVVASLIFPGVTNVRGAERTQQTLAFMRANGLPATFTEPEEVAETAMDAIRRESFWARQSVDDPAHRETVEWEAQIYRTQAEANIARAQPDAYLWGPASNLLGP
ncbi:MAG TPA: SDR family NAD(P)-dependent oxidoreductase [Frankiaceae bacterium]|nr:SDR family NAD(P)-dependent oxidoreductase [Frankiaceae bacterium]